MKKVIGIVLIFVLFCIVGWMIYASVKTISKKADIAASINEVPEFTLQKPDSSYVQINNEYSKSPLFIIHFNSECDFCEEEAKAIAENHVLLKDIQMVFISLEPLQNIKQFGDTVGLSVLTNVLLGKIDDKTADEILGITTAPQLFIYDKNGKLEKQYKGFTKIETLLKYVNKL